MEIRELDDLGVGDVVQDTDRYEHVDARTQVAPVKILEASGSELRVRELRACRRDVLLARLEPDVAHTVEVLQHPSGAAPDVQYHRWFTTLAIALR